MSSFFLVSFSSIQCHLNEKFSYALQLYDTILLIYGRDLAQLVSDLQNDKLNGTDSGISIKVKALETIVCAQSEQMRVGQTERLCRCHISHFSQTALWVENVK